MANRQLIRLVLGFFGWVGMLFAFLIGLGALLAAPEASRQYLGDTSDELGWVVVVVHVASALFIFFVSAFVPSVILLALMIEEHLHDIRLCTRKRLHEMSQDLSAMLSDSRLPGGFRAANSK